MLDKADAKAIADLQARMKIVESETNRIRAQIDALEIASSDALLKTSGISTEIRWIRETLENMAVKKIRAVEVALAIGGIIIGIITAYTSIQMVQLTKAMMEISRALK